MVKVQKIELSKVPVETLVECYKELGYKSRKYILRKMRIDGFLTTDGQKQTLTVAGIEKFFSVWEAKLGASY